MADKELEPGARRTRLEQQLQAEEAKRDQLRLALSDFRHTGRRLGDRLERLGGRGPDVERQRALLEENLKLTEAELSKAEAQISKIRRELAELTAD